MLIDRVVFDNFVVDHLLNEEWLALPMILKNWYFGGLHEVEVLVLHLHPKNIIVRVSTKLLVLNLFFFFTTLNSNHLQYMKWLFIQ